MTNSQSERALLWWTIVPLVELYIAFAIASVTHSDLFLVSPVKLPLLGVPIPLLAMAFAAPGALLLLLAGAFLHWRRFGARLREQGGEAPLRFLVGSRAAPSGLADRVLRAIAWLALTVAPVLILLEAQMAFLPFHSPLVTWIQRGGVALGLVLVWLGWRGVKAADAPARSGRLAAAACLAVLVFSCGLATFPGEWADRQIGNARIVPATFLPDRSKAEDWTSLSDVLFGSYPGGGWLPGLGPNYLDLAQRAFGPAPFGDPDGVGPSLRGRRLEKANFFLADVRRVDFSEAFLDGANFVQADVREAKFTRAIMRRASFGNGAMDGADFSEADLEGSDFNGTLPGLNFRRAHLRGASFGFGVPTHLEGANLAGAELEGAIFERVFLQGADLRGAKLAGATFGWNVAGPSPLDGANLDGAELQGAAMAGVRLAGASLRGARVWRTMGEPDVHLADATAIDRTTKPTLDIEALRRLSATNPLKDEQAPRLAALDPAQPEPEKATPARSWQTTAPTTKALAEFLADLACKPAEEPPVGAPLPHIARGLLANGRIAATGRDVAIVADRMKAAQADPAACPGVAGFGEKDWALLDSVVAQASAR